MMITTEAMPSPAVVASRLRLVDELHRAQALLAELDKTSDWSRSAETIRSARVLSQLRFLVAAVDSYTAEREYGVRLRVPGEDDRIIPCGDDLAGAEVALSNPPRGAIAVEIVSRTASDWTTAPEALAANVRATAEQFLDEEIAENTVRTRLLRWLSGRDLNEVMSGPWRDLLDDIEQYRKADDGVTDWRMTEFSDQESFVQHREAIVKNAVRTVIEGAA